MIPLPSRASNKECARQSRRARAVLARAGFAEGASDDDVGRSSLGRGRAKIIREDRNDDPDYSEGSVGPNQPPSGLALPLGNVLLDIPAQHHAIAQSGNDGVSSGSSVGQLLSDALDSKPSEFCVLIGTESHTTIVVPRCPLSEQGTCERVLTQRGCASETNHPRRAHLI